MPPLKTTELTTADRAPDAAVIWLHGLGADGDDFVPVVPELRLPASMAVRFIFPHAPAIPVTINMGYVMPAWYDLLALTPHRRMNRDQFNTACDAIATIIDGEIERNIPPERVIIAGFSQGGTIAYETVFRYPQKLAGLIAMSSFIACEESLGSASANVEVPVQIMHGNRDTVVPMEMGREAKARLEHRGFEPVYTEYDMAHEVCMEEIADIGRCLRRWLS